MPTLMFGKQTPFEINDNSFVIGKDSFNDLEIQSKPSITLFYYFFNTKKHKLVKQFILHERDKVSYICSVTLIKKDDKFTPRIEFSVRDKARIIQKEKTNKDSNMENDNVKARVDMRECHKQFWELISYLQSLREIDTPNKHFSLISQEEGEIVKALQGRNITSIKNIIKQLTTVEGIILSQEEIDQLLKRKEKLKEFNEGLKKYSINEDWWQDFFEKNKWIFGYGLNYQILKHEQSQPYYGGTGLDGKGGQKGDYLTSTSGNLNFTVLIEIKTPNTPLLQGNTEIRTGAWSLSKDLTDAISQIQANIDMWNKHGSQDPNNRDRLEKENIFTVQPKGIIIIGLLGQLINNKSKRETFQRFRKSLHGIDILTFDELFERAKFIVKEKS